VKKFALLLASIALALLASGCTSQGDPAEPPLNFKAVAGDASAIVTWDAQPGVEYWVFWGPGENITTSNWVQSGGRVIVKATSPQVITGLVNGRTYSVTINGRTNGGPGGPGAPTQVVVPTLAGTNWAIGTPLGTGRLAGVAAGLGASGYANVTVGEGGAIYASVASGPVTARTNPAAPADLNAVFYGGLGFVSVGANGTIVVSGDGTTWNTRTSGVTNALNGGSSIGTTGGYFAVGSGGTILTSTDGTTWTPSPSGTTSDLFGATFGNARLVVVGSGGTILSSADGATWTAASSGTSADLKGVAYASISTTNADNSVTFTNAFVAVGAGGTVLFSSDGTTWTPQSAFTSLDLSAVVYGGQFVAVGKAGGIFTSLDGVTWQVRNSGTPNDLAAVARTLSGYSAVGAAGTNITSF